MPVSAVETRCLRKTATISARFPRWSTQVAVTRTVDGHAGRHVIGCGSRAADDADQIPAFYPRLFERLQRYLPAPAIEPTWIKVVSNTPAPLH